MPDYLMGPVCTGIHSERRFHLFQAASWDVKNQHTLKSGLLHYELFLIVISQRKESKSCCVTADCLINTLVQGNSHAQT